MDMNATTHHYHTSIYNTTIQKDWAFILSLSSYCKWTTQNYTQKGTSQPGDSNSEDSCCEVSANHHITVLPIKMRNILSHI